MWFEIPCLFIVFYLSFQTNTSYFNLKPTIHQETPKICLNLSECLKRINFLSKLDEKILISKY